MCPSIVFFILLALCSLTSSARISNEEVDYNSLMSLLNDYDDEGTNVEAEAQFNGDVSPYEATRNVGAGVQFSLTKPSIGAVATPHVEVLNLVEAFLKLKGEMASRIHALINDNFDLFRAVYNVVMSKVAKLHSFTLAGVTCLRRIIEFAVSVISTWEVNKPSVSFAFDKLVDLI